MTSPSLARWIRASMVPSSPGGGTGSKASHQGKERSAGSAEMRLWRWVVPVRGSPAITTGRSMGTSRASGWSLMYCSMRRRLTAKEVSWLKLLTLPMGEWSASLAIEWHNTSSGARNSSGPKSLSPVWAAAAPRIASGLSSISSASGAVCSIISAITGASTGSTRSSMRIGAGRSLTPGRLVVLDWLYGNRSRSVGCSVTSAISS